MPANDLIEAAAGSLKVDPGFTWGAAGGWATFAAIATIIAAIVRAVGVRELAELIINRGKTIRDEKRVEEQSNSAKIAALDGRLERLGGALLFLMNAVTTSIDGLESDDRKVRDIAAHRARESIAMAASTLGNEDPFSKALDRLANAPGSFRKAGE